MLITDRRTFLHSIGAFCVLTSSNAPVEYVATGKSIEVFRTEKGRRIKLQAVPSRKPSGLTLDAHRRFLFAANEISEYEGLPAGSVESYAIQPSGHLKLINRAALSLSATLPKHLAMSPDCQHLVVAAFGGGSYNVLPIGNNGAIGPVTQIIKEIGHGPHPRKQACAHPHSVLFHPSGQFIVATDLGSDRINVFAFNAGRLHRLHKIAADPGSQPAQLAMNAEGTLLSIRHDATGATSRYHFAASDGRLTKLS